MLVKVHASPLQPGQWWACQQPDHDPRVPGPVYDEHCPLCQQKAAKDLAVCGDAQVFNVETAEVGGRLSDLVGWGLTEWPR